jgi:NAD(P)H-dependent flavin oxidoreductase YrpB (nitropropane dioxygenase family)
MNGNSRSFGMTEKQQIPPPELGGGMTAISSSAIIDFAARVGALGFIRGEPDF